MRRLNVFVAAVASVVCLLLVGCGRHSTDLSRAEAKRLVSKAIQELARKSTSDMLQAGKAQNEVPSPQAIDKMYDLEITGIMDSQEGGKQVEYTVAIRAAIFSKEDLRKLPPGYLAPHQGQADIRLYDDGWRVVFLNGRRYPN